MFAYGETVTRLRLTAAADRFSGEATSADWSNPDELDIPNCAFDPGDSLEPLAAGRDAVLTKPTVYAPSGSDVTALDRLIVRGRTWQVDGDPSDYRSPFSGWRPGMVIHLKAVSG
jgi:hypothetical protein